MTMLPLPRNNDSMDLVADFLANGGTVTKCSPGARTEEISYTSGFYGRKKKPSSNTEADEDNS
jgi:hypothetical protein